jgi:hypothetical protein
MSDAEHEPQEEEQESVSELLDQFGRDTRALLAAELAYTASEHAPELRRAGRDAAATVVVGLAFLAAFALANVAAVDALSDVASGWRAPLLLAAGWAVVGIVLALALGVRTSRLLGISLSPGDDGPSRLEARDAAQAQVRETLERLAGAVASEAEGRIATAVVPIAGGIVDAGEDILEATGENLEELVEQVPEAGAAGQVIDLVLLPGRIGVRVVTSVLRRPPG